jgi:hypothetical protein
MKLADVKSIREIEQEYQKRLDEIMARYEAGQLRGDALDQAFRQAYEDYAKALREKAIQEKKACCLEYRGELEWQKIHTPEDWENLLATSRADYMSGRFFLERVVRERHVDPSLVATLLELRQSWITEYQIETAPEFLLLDMALVSYYHFLRFHGMMLGLEFHSEHELFGLDEPRVKYDERWRPQGWLVQDYLQRLREELFPQLDRLNRMFLRNLKALRDLKRANVELHIGQVNIGKRQVNIAALPRRRPRTGKQRNS